MSPEQLKGKDADARSDIFAFGAVLYEMVDRRAGLRGRLPGRAGRGDPRAPAAAACRAPAARAAGARPSGHDVPGEGPRRPLAERARHRARAEGSRSGQRRARRSGSAAAGELGARPPSPDPAPVARARGLGRGRAHARGSGVVLGYRRPTTPRRPNPVPVVVLMDSPLRGRVYDARTLAAGGTNADDISDALRV